jgi:hypothetical protein
MSPSTFLETLKTEVARMQRLHPERENEIARAYALVLHGMVVPSPEDPATGQVLSSDGSKVYHVNGTCDCDAGFHGLACKHVSSWRLYQHIASKALAQPEPEVVVDNNNPPLPEAPPLYEAPAWKRRLWEGSTRTPGTGPKSRNGPSAPPCRRSFVPGKV